MMSFSTPTLWSTTSTATSTVTSPITSNKAQNGGILIAVNGDASAAAPDSTHDLSGGGSGGGGMGNGALDEARFRYKNSVATVRDVLAAIPNSHKAKPFETSSSADEAEIEKLEEQASNLRKKIRVIIVAYPCLLPTVQHKWRTEQNDGPSAFKCGADLCFCIDYQPNFGFFFKKKTAHVWLKIVLRLQAELTFNTHIFFSFYCCPSPGNATSSLGEICSMGS